jgi:lipopolysaccharide exporter
VFNRLRSPFVRHVATLMSGRLMAQTLSIALAPVIARLFEPGDFGVVALFITVANLLAIVAPLRYFRASLLIHDDESARMVLAMSAWLLLFGCTLILAVVALSGSDGFSSGFFAPLGGWVWLIPLAAFLYGMTQILTTVYTRDQIFRPVAVSDFIQTVLTGGTRILAGLGGSSVWGLITGALIGSTGRMLLLSRRSINPVSLFRTPISWGAFKELAVEYKSFPLHNMTAGLVTFVSGKVPILVMGAIFAPATVGFYAMADRLIRMPVVSTGTAVREVFLRKLAGNSKGAGGFRKPLALLTLAMLLLGVVPFGVLGFYGGDVMTFVLGERWADAGTYVQILAPWYYVSWVSTGVQPTLIALGRQGLWLRLQITGLLGRVAVFGIAYLASAGVETTLKWFSGVNVLTALFILIFVFYLASKERTHAASSGE